MTGFDNEHILPDDYPIYGDYLYVVDGKPYRSDFHGITAAELRRQLNATEVRRCNIYARRALALTSQKPESPPHEKAQP